MLFIYGSLTNIIVVSDIIRNGTFVKDIFLT